MMKTLEKEIVYKLHGHTKHQEIPIAVENRKGSYRHGTDKDGKPWHTLMRHHYGYIKGTKGADGDEVDAYVGPEKKTPNVFVVHQRKEDGKTYDEDKVMLGFKNKEHAKQEYLKHYNDQKFLGPVKTIPIERFKELITTGKKLTKISQVMSLSFLDELANITHEATHASQ